MRRAIATFHDLFVLTGEYSTGEFRARFAAQARDAAQRSAAIIAVSEFTRNAVVSLLGVDASKVRVVHHGVRDLPISPPLLQETEFALTTLPAEGRAAASSRST